MAKIGNEAKLILKLAEERTAAKVKNYEAEAANAGGNDNKLATSYRNKAAGIVEGYEVLKDIYLELETQ